MLHGSRLLLGESAGLIRIWLFRSSTTSQARPTRATTTTTCGDGYADAASRHRIARKGVETSQRLGRHRWTIERTMAWLAGCRRLHRRYERKADHFLAFTSIACTLICYRRLTK